MAGTELFGSTCVACSEGTYKSQPSLDKFGGKDDHEIVGEVFACVWLILIRFNQYSF